MELDGCIFHNLLASATSLEINRVLDTYAKEHCPKCMWTSFFLDECAYEDVSHTICLKTQTQKLWMFLEDPCFEEYLNQSRITTDFLEKLEPHGVYFDDVPDAFFSLEYRHNLFIDPEYSDEWKFMVQNYFDYFWKVM